MSELHPPVKRRLQRVAGLHPPTRVPGAGARALCAPANRRLPRARAWHGLIACLVLLVAIPVGGARAVSLGELVAGLRIDASAISVSGVSSGGYMAQQFHVAHSRHVNGAGIIAGGPYRCAAGSYPPYTWFDASTLYAATSRCSDTNPWWFYQGPPDLDFSIRETRREAARGAIDSLDGLAGDRVWLLSGSRDKTVPRGVMDILAGYYAEFLDSANIQYVTLDDAGHAMITDDFGNDCAATATPYLNDCDLDAAGELLAHLLGPMQPRAPRADPEAILTFDQGEFVDGEDASISMNAIGHLYLPAPCRRGEPCRLHVVFHGCRQYQELIGTDFYTEAGYNEWAQTNRLVILYPQTAPWQGLRAGNPRGCWDWWGYSGDNYHTRAGKQMRAVAAMIDVLLGARMLTRAAAAD